jgi:hypothetical protein
MPFDPTLSLIYQSNFYTYIITLCFIFFTSSLTLIPNFMRTKTLLFLMLLSCGVLNAQDTIKTLIITEARLDDARHTYVEITNMGTTPVNLAQFELGVIGAWDQPYAPGANNWFMLPNKELAAGKSFVVAGVYDWNPKMWVKDPDHFQRILNKKEFWTLADVKLHFPESPKQPNPDDSVTRYNAILGLWNGRDCLYLRQHISETDSVVVDQVNGVFANPNGTRAEPKGALDVAGVTAATNNATLVRKFKIKQGNTDFETGRGQDLAESEWIPLPLQLGHWEMMRKLFWTAGNHGDYKLDPSTLTSSTVDIDWTKNIITVPWGVRNDDSIMSEFSKAPGIAWHYAYAPSYADSAYVSIRNGDILTLYACGDELDMREFTLKVAAPTADANWVMPMNVPNADGFYAGTGPMFMVSANKNGVLDTIQGANYRGITFATRVDTLFKYLEKAPKASWEIIWVDGNVRTDLKTGDKLKVTAENGETREYFIKADDYRPSHDAFLSSITWPDIPEDFKVLYGWLGDTIPNYEPTKYEYKVQVPLDTYGIPALVGKNANSNGKVTVAKPTNLYGGPENRTMTFTSVAEDDTSVRVYNVLLEKERSHENLQPWAGDPFISQFIWQEQWDNTFIEVMNPGTDILDMSNYMFCFGYVNSPAEAITRLGQPGDSTNRYGKYIPGYKWKTGAAWATDPAVAEQDLNVNPLVYPGDVFVLGDIRSTGNSGYPWWASQQCDIDFGHLPWGNEKVNAWTALKQWSGANWYLFKIDNDSVKLGTKPALDPNDFTLIDVFGSGDGSDPVVGGEAIHQIIGYTRKPEIYKGNPEFKGSFGTDVATSEWTMVDEKYYNALSTPWPQNWLQVAVGIGSHFMNDVSIYKSTVASNAYKVSLGYLSPQTIRGLASNVKVADLYNNLIKADTGQKFAVRSAYNGAILGSTAVLKEGDTLIVKSADLKNVTKYVVSLTPLDDNALLTSDTYDIAVTGATGSVSGFDYGTKLKDIADGVTAPETATFAVIDAAGAYVPYKMLNYDTLYVDQMVNSQIYFEVIAENGINKIVYQLTPNTMETDAFVTSSVYDVDQEASLINLVPDGIATSGLMNDLVPAPGATMKLYDKMGYDRMFGRVMKDDKLVVTASDEVTTKAYYLQMLGDVSYSLAYVLSDAYSVDQVGYTIWGYFDETTSVADLIANLIPAPGASVKVTDAAGVENTGSLVMGDKVVVTSGNGANVVNYVLLFPTGINNQNQNSISIYPNPTSDRVTISGLMSGNRIRVNNIMGVVVLDKTAQLDKEVLSLQGQRFGIYFITVSNADGVVGRYKLILK